MKEHQNDRYLTTQDGEVFDRLTNSFVVDIEPINTYEKMPQKVDGDNAEAVAETILKALSAYEKLQGVDFDLMASVYEEERAKYIGGTVYYPHNQAAFKGAMRKAIDKLVADVGGDG